MTRNASIVGRLAACLWLVAACDDVLPVDVVDGGQTNVAFCSGRAFDVCGALAPPSCGSVPGCFEVGTCSGISGFCFDYTFDVNCAAAGCTWVAGVEGMPGSCVGNVTPCSAYVGREACTATGVCAFVTSGSCVGTATCASADAARCLSVPGCSLACPAPFVLCGGTCVSQDAATASGCVAAF